MLRLNSNDDRIGGMVQNESTHGGVTSQGETASGQESWADALIDTKEEILRVDAIANTVFEVCMAVAAASVAVVFAASSEIAQAAAGVTGVIVGVLALIAAPEVVFGFGRSSAESYLKKRRRYTELAIIGLFLMVYLGLAFGLAYVVGDITEEELAGLVVGVAAVIGVVWIIKGNWNDLWPPEIRG